MARNRGRTRNFEEGLDPSDLGQILGRTTPDTAAGQDAPADPPEQPADDGTATADSATAQPEPPRPSPRQRRPRAAPASPTAAHGDEKKRKPSVVYVSQDNVTKIKHLREEKAWSSGMVILQAINDTYGSGKLKERLGGRTMTSDLFGDFTSRVASTSELNKMPLNVRLNPDHYGVIDRLVDELGADSRSHLINTALDEYFKAEDLS